MAARRACSDGPREAVDAHVLAMFGIVLAELTTGELYEPRAAGSLAEAVVKHLPPRSPVPGFLRRLLLAGGDSGRELFRRLYEGSRAALDAMSAAGLADRGADPATASACSPRHPGAHPNAIPAANTTPSPPARKPATINDGTNHGPFGRIFFRTDRGARGRPEERPRLRGV